MSPAPISVAGHPCQLLERRLWFSQTPKLLINWGLPFFLRFPCSPPLVALAAAFLAFFRQRTALQLEILALRHQLGVLHRSVKRPKLTAADRFFWAWLAAVWTDWQPSAIIMRPATVIGWHLRGFGLFWPGRTSWELFRIRNTCHYSGFRIIPHRRVFCRGGLDCGDSASWRTRNNTAMLLLLA